MQDLGYFSAQGLFFVLLFTKTFVNSSWRSKRFVLTKQKVCPDEAKVSSGWFEKTTYLSPFFLNYTPIDLFSGSCDFFLLLFSLQKNHFPYLFPIKKAQNHWLVPRFFERIFNARPRVISVTVSNYGLKVVKCCKMWRKLLTSFNNFWCFFVKAFFQKKLLTFKINKTK